MNKINISEALLAPNSTNAVLNTQRSESISFLDIGASIKYKSSTKLILTFKLTTQTSSFVEKAAAHMVDPAYKLLIDLFSKLPLHDRIFFSPSQSDGNVRDLKMNSSSDQELPSCIRPAEFRKRRKAKASSSFLSRSQRLPKSVKNKKLFRNLQLHQRDGSFPLKSFLLFPKLPPELRIRIWRFSFVGRRIVIDPKLIFTLEDPKMWNNHVMTPNPVQLLVNQESRAEVQLHYDFSPDWCASYAQPHIYPESSLQTQKLGIYYHSEIDELSLLPKDYQGQLDTSVFWRKWVYCSLALRLQNMQSLIISEASWTARDILGQKSSWSLEASWQYMFSYARFHHLREITIYPGKTVIQDEDNLLHTELGRKSCSDFLKELFINAQKHEDNTGLTVRIPVITIHC